MKRKINYNRILITLFIMILLITAVITLFKKESKENLLIDLVGLPQQEVIEYLTKEAIEINFKEEYHDDIGEGLVISQSILPGTEITDEMNLIITISLGEVNSAVYEKYRVNELGRVPVMMYHGIFDVPSSETNYIGGNHDLHGYNRTKEAFINDLEFYYNNDYRMIRLQDYIDGIIDVELGKSPIILTFDDGNRNNFNVLGLTSDGELIIDPDSAIGVLENFKKKYPDFNVTATFFLNGGLFSQPQYNQQILKWLVDNGYDIGNHTYTHNYLDRISKEKVEEEIGKMYQLLEEMIPNKYVNIVSLPFGLPSNKSHDNFSNILKGSYDEMNYITDATLRVGWQQDYSPFSQNFDKEYIMRIRAYDNNGDDFDIEYVFKTLENNRYISDGNKNQIVVRETDIQYLSDKNTLEVISY